MFKQYTKNITVTVSPAIGIQTFIIKIDFYRACLIYLKLLYRKAYRFQTLILSVMLILPMHLRKLKANNFLLPPAEGQEVLKQVIRRSMMFDESFFSSTLGLIIFLLLGCRCSLAVSPASSPQGLLFFRQSQPPH